LSGDGWNVEQASPLKTQLDWQFRDFWAIIQPFTDSSSHPKWCRKNPRCGPAARRMMPMEWQRHFERHATPQMGRNCGFWVHRSASGSQPQPLWLCGSAA
jgi:hypothetical protein